jgi:hypothetical protein
MLHLCIDKREIKRHFKRQLVSLERRKMFFYFFFAVLFLFGKELQRLYALL